MIRKVCRDVPRISSLPRRPSGAGGWGLVLGGFALALIAGPLSAADEPFAMPVLHKQGVSALAVSPDSQLIATGGRDGTVIIWSVPEKKQVTTLEGERRFVWSLAFSPDGKVLAAGTTDLALWLWDTATWKARDVLHSSGGLIPLAYSPDGKFLAIAEPDHKLVRLWDTEQMIKRVRFDGHTVPIECLAYSPDGKFVASGGYQQLKLWDVAARKEEADLKGHKEAIKSVAFRPDSKVLASAGLDGTVKLWEVATHKLLRTLGHDREKKNILWVQFTPDGKTLASYGSDGIVFWDPDSGKLRRQLTKFTNDVTALAFSSDGKTLVSGHRKGLVLLWDLDGQ